MTAESFMMAVEPKWVFRSVCQCTSMPPTGCTEVERGGGKRRDGRREELQKEGRK